MGGRDGCGDRGSRAGGESLGGGPRIPTVRWWAFTTTRRGREKTNFFLLQQLGLCQTHILVATCDAQRRIDLHRSCRLHVSTFADAIDEKPKHSRLTSAILSRCYQILVFPCWHPTKSWHPTQRLQITIGIAGLCSRLWRSGRRLAIQGRAIANFLLVQLVEDAELDAIVVEAEVGRTKAAFSRDFFLDHMDPISPLL